MYEDRFVTQVDSLPKGVIRDADTPWQRTLIAIARAPDSWFKLNRAYSDKAGVTRTIRLNAAALWGEDEADRLEFAYQPTLLEGVELVEIYVRLPAAERKPEPVIPTVSPSDLEEFFTDGAEPDVANYVAAATREE